MLAWFDELLIGILYEKTLFQWQYKGIFQNSETGSSYEESNDRSVAHDSDT